MHYLSVASRGTVVNKSGIGKIGFSVYRPDQFGSYEKETNFSYR